MEIVILGEPAIKKNSKQIFRNSRTGRPFVTSSKNWQKYETSAITQILEQTERRDLILGKKCEVKLTFYTGTKRKKDLTNMAEGVMDCLVEASVIDDDNCFVVSDLRLVFGGIDKKNPRTEVRIKEVKEDI